jgi:hypothetical protein
MSGRNMWCDVTNFLKLDGFLKDVFHVKKLESVTEINPELSTITRKHYRGWQDSDQQSTDL